MDRFIVAEVSKNWVRNQPLIQGSRTISQTFEDVVNVNHERGYRLHSFTMHRLQMGNDEMNETIIAVFEKEET